MKHRHLTLFAALMLAMTFTLSSCGGGKYSRSTPEELGKSLFEVLKSNDRDGLKELIPQKDDLMATLKNADMPEEQRSEMMEEFDKEWPEMEEEMQGDVFGRFDEFQEEIKEEGIDPAKLEFVKVETDNERSREGLNMIDIKVVFKFEDEEVNIKVRKAAKMESGWVMSPDGFRVR